MNNGLNDLDVKKILKDILPKFTKLLLLDFEIYKENVSNLIVDVTHYPFSKVPLCSIPKDCRLFLRVQMKDPQSGRVITGVASTCCLHGTIAHTSNIEIIDIITLPKDIDRNGLIKKDVIGKISNSFAHFVQFVISLVNALINIKLIKIAKN